MKQQRAISIRQPWVELILQGKKREEYRSQPTNLRGRLYLYAAQTPANSPAAWAGLGCEPGGLPTGRVLGSVEIVDCEWSASQQAYAYKLRHPRRLTRPRAARNAPSPRFWIPKF